MVSQQATKSPRARGLLSHQICNDFIGRGASVDIIAYKNEFMLNVACAPSAEVKEGPELFKATVDVAYCESETLSHAVSPIAHVGGTEIKSRKIKDITVTDILANDRRECASLMASLPKKLGTGDMIKVLRSAIPLRLLSLRIAANRSTHGITNNRPYRLALFRERYL